MQEEKTLKEILSNEDNVSEVMIIWDMWDKPGSTNREQHNSGYIKKEDAIKKYGDFIYGHWYTSGYSEFGGFKADIWADNPNPYINAE